MRWMNLAMTLGTTATLLSVAPGALAAPTEADKPRAPVELGIFGGMMFPSSSHALVAPGYTHEAYDSPAPEIGARVAYLPLAYLGIEAEGAGMPAKTESGAKGGFWAARAHAIGQYPLGSFTPFVILGGGALGASSSANGADADFAIHFGAGAKLALDDFVGLRLDVRDTLSQKYGASDGTMTHFPEALLGLTFSIGPARQPAPPPPLADGDHDGKTDDVDRCPNEAADTSDGCPEKDSDGDGVLDGRDACPSEAGAAPCGCPIRDRDGDKVIDSLDKCPSEPGPIDGCPDPDADRDGVSLPADKCPDRPETKNGFEDEDGCPDQIPEKVKKFTGVIQGIEFGRGKDTIRPTSTAVLDAAESTLAEYPALRIEISGHTDTDGSREANVDLSKRRAEAVKAYFVSKGIAEDRIATRGAGPDEPIADNKTPAGRQKNRRIEFKLVQ